MNVAFAGTVLIFSLDFQALWLFDWRAIVTLQDITQGFLCTICVSICVPVMKEVYSTNLLLVRANYVEFLENFKTWSLIGYYLVLAVHWPLILIYEKRRLMLLNNVTFEVVCISYAILFFIMLGRLFRRSQLKGRGKEKRQSQGAKTTFPRVNLGYIVMESKIRNSNPAVAIIKDAELAGERSENNKKKEGWISESSHKTDIKEKERGSATEYTIPEFKIQRQEEELQTVVDHEGDIEDIEANATRRDLLFSAVKVGHQL